jgi:hypothetical protein
LLGRPKSDGARPHAHNGIQVAADPDVVDVPLSEHGPALDLEGNVAEEEIESVVDVVVAASVDASVERTDLEIAEGARLIGLRQDLHRSEIRDFITGIVEESRTGLAGAQREADASPPVIDTCISLVASAEDCFFVRWVSYAKTQFRRVTLDKRGRIVTIVATWVPIETLGGERVVIRDVGVRMLVAKAEGRPLMPSWCILLQRRCLAELYPGPMVRRGDDQSDCVACMGVQSFYEGSAETGGNIRPRCADLFACCSCVQRWHLECAMFYSVSPEHLQHVVATSDAFQFRCPFCD